MEQDKIPAKIKFPFFFKKIETARKEVSLRSGIDSQVDFFIDNNDWKSIGFLIDEKFNFSKQQMKNLIFSLDNKMDYDERKKLRENNRPILKEILVDTLNDCEQFLDKAKKPLNFIREKEIIKKNYYILHIISWTEYSFFNSDKSEIEEMFNLTLKLKNKVSSLAVKNKDDNGPYRGISHSIKNLFERFQELKSTQSREDLKLMVKTSKDLNSKNIEITISQDIIKQIRNFDSKKLPKEAKEIFDDIQGMFITVNGNRDKFTTKQLLDIENLQNKRFPQVIQEYITIPDRYREVLKSQKDSPDLLVIDSLKQIKAHTWELTHVVLDNHIHDMKKTNQYLKSI